MKKCKDPGNLPFLYMKSVQGRNISDFLSFLAKLLEMLCQALSVGQVVQEYLTAFNARA